MQTIFFVCSRFLYLLAYTVTLRKISAGGMNLLSLYLFHFSRYTNDESHMTK